MVAETFEKLVKTMTEQKASDLFLTVGLPPVLSSMALWCLLASSLWIKSSARPWC